MDTMCLIAAWTTYAVLIVVILLIMIIAVAAAVIRRKIRQGWQSPYVGSPLLTPAEQAFRLVLMQALPDDYVLFAMVRLADILNVKKGFDARTRQGHFNRIASKHADFVICDNASLVPSVIIELDDSSHERRAASERDRQKDAILEGAGLAVLRIKAQRIYDVADLRGKLLAALTGQGQGSSIVSTGSLSQASVVVEESGAKTCPKCGSPMVRRVAKHGSKKGEEFWGCSRYPHCKGIVTVD